jgi:hypothetical protein
MTKNLHDTWFDLCKESKNIKRDGVCNCNKCIEDRRKEFIDKIFKVYLDLPFIPNCIDHIMSKWNIDNITIPLDYETIVPYSFSENNLSELSPVFIYFYYVDFYNRKVINIFEDAVHCLHCGKLHPAEKGLKIKNYSNNNNITSSSPLKKMGFHPNDVVYVCPSCQEYYRTCIECGYSDVTVHFCKGSVDSEGNFYATYVSSPPDIKTKPVSVCIRCMSFLYQECTVCGIKSKNTRDFIFVRTLNSLADLPICPNCQEKKRRYCMKCDEEVYLGVNNNPVYEEDTHIGELCPFCRQKHNVLHPYSFKPNTIFQSIRSKSNRKIDTLYYGAEYEVNFKGNISFRDAAVQFTDKFGKEDQYLKEDSSLINGFEMVSHPYTWNYYRKNRKRWNEIINWLANHDGIGMEVYKSTGLHIHMSKKAFNSIHLFKFIRFFYDTNNRKFIKMIAGRSNPGYASFEPEDQNKICDFAKMKRNPSDNRHSAINLSQPGTVEIRIFGNLIDPFYFHKNMEFCQSLYLFTKDTSIKKTSVDDYLDYLDKTTYSNQYRKLLHFIQEVG